MTTLINTHSHHDHVSGNVAFPASVDIVTHAVTAANMAVMRAYSGRTEPPANVFADSMGRGLPTVTFAERMSLGSGADQVDLYHFGRGHTGGDAWIVFPALRTLHSGDIFPGKNLPFLDANNGGSGVDIADTLQKAHDTIRGVDTIITGHSSQMTWADLHEYAAFNRDFLAAVRAGRAAGQTVDQIAGAWTIPAGYEATGRRGPPGSETAFRSSSTSSTGTARSSAPSTRCLLRDRLLDPTVQAHAVGAGGEGGALVQVGAHGFTPAASRKAAMARTAARLGRRSRATSISTSVSSNIRGTSGRAPGSGRRRAVPPRTGPATAMRTTARHPPPSL